MQGPVLGVAPGAALPQPLRGRPIEGFERSFRLSKGRVLDDRWLAGIHKSDLPPRELEAACLAMGMDRSHAGAVLANAEAASTFHFGYEGADEGAIHKVYLEFASRLSQSGVADGEQSFLLYLAWKWKAGDPSSCTLARYECFPGLDEREQVSRIGRVAPEVSRGVGALVDVAAGRTGRPPMYLEVTEEGNPRLSFDINLHAASIPIDSLESWLVDVARRMSISADSIDAALSSARGAMLGHLSGGTSRDGREFLTVYYPAKPTWHG